MRTCTTKALAIASACALGLLACKGDTGPAGTTGPTGATGPTGSSGISTGTVAGRVTNATTGNPVSGATVATSPNEGTATTDANGNYSLVLPIGTYTLTFSGTGITTTTKTVSVVAGGTATVNLGAPYTPIVLTAAPATAPAGFGATAQLGVTVSGGTAPYAYAWTAKSTNPTAVTLSSATDPAPTFTTGTLKDVAASGKVVGFGTVRTVPGFLPVSAQQLGQMTYSFTVKVTDAANYTQTTTVSVPPATLAQGNGIVPLNQVVILNVPGNAAAQTLTKPSGSNAILNEADQVNPWFIPDVAGAYAVGGLTANAGDFKPASPTCGGCHDAATQAAVAAKYQAWNDSAHGNHFFKYMAYDMGGTLTWMTDMGGNPIPAPTADPTIFWTNPGAMTTFEFGMTGGEGSHYSASCVGCHTTGYNALASNNGADDAMAAAGWTFPDLKAAFGGDAVTSAPNFTVWNAIPASVKAYAGMQCESCHGPLAQHAATAAVALAPQPEYDVGACAVCHDRPSNHDRVFLWRQSKHADLALAEEESVVESRGVSTSCYRCHSAQGFVAYLPQQQAGNPGAIARPSGLTPAPATCTPTPQPGGDYDPACPCTPAAGQTTCTGDPAFYAWLSGLGLNRAQVQSQTCAACHDPHATEIRVDGNTGPLANGWQMQGAGAGALCMVCHNTRNGARGDSVTVSSIGGPHAPVQADLYFGQNAYFMGSGGQVSKHAAVQETCVGCHMLLHPASLSVRNTNHVFTADGTICGACHGSGVGLEALEGQFLVNRGYVETALAAAFGAAVGGATPNYYVLVADPGGSGSYAVVNLTAAPTAIVPSGRTQNLTMTFAAGVSDGWGNTVTTLTVNFQNVSLGNATNAGVTAFTTPLFSKTGIIAKVNWNYWLVSSTSANPAANVIHNPSFVWEVLSATTSALQAAAAAGGSGL